MNLPNKLTVIRICLVPFFVFFLLQDGIPHHALFAFLLFTGASLTDLLDGKIARRDNLVTNFGKFLDPLADKILVTAALICFVAMGFASPAAVLIIVSRDFIVSGIRMLAASSDGTVIAANWWGKVKTALQMICICCTLAFLEIWEVVGMFQVNLLTYEFLYFLVRQFSFWGIWAVSVFTAVSGVVYIWQNKSLISDY